MTKKLDVEITVDVTEDLGLEASGKVKGYTFLGKATKGAVKLVCSEIGQALARAMSNDSEKEEVEVEAEVEEIPEEVLV